MLDAAFAAKSSSTLQLSGDVTVPVSTIATGGADVLGLGNVLDVGVGADYSRSHKDTISFRAKGEKVFAIRYQKISFQTLQTEVDGKHISGEA